MCGIAGWLGAAPRRPEQYRAALDAMQSRGPDARGETSLGFGDAAVWLGHTRLSIQDLTPAGAQPMLSQNGRWWVSFNGEIFNHLSIRDQLSRAWRGHADTETLVEAISEWGVEATLARLNGMFAFAAFDIDSGRLYLARDPFGIKPVYVWHRGGEFAFASSVRALHHLQGGSFRLDHESLQSFLCLRFVPSPHTLYEGVSRVPAGHCLVLDVGRDAFDLRRYVRPVTESFAGTLDDAVAEYTRLVRQAVQRQLLSDVPVGVFLSGGVDSALVAAAAAECGKSLPCFTVGFGADVAECEIADAAETAALLGLAHEPVTLDGGQLWGVLESSIGAIEEPLGTTSMLPMWHLSVAASQQVSVVLTGQGSDEPLGGYRRYQMELYRDIVPLRLGLAAASPFLRRVRGLPEFVERAADSIAHAALGERLERAYALFSGDMRHAMTGRSDAGRSRHAIEQWLAWANGGRRLSSAEAMMQVDTRMGLADDLLLYGDKISMAHSIEARVPMLDADLVRFVESLPRPFKLSYMKTKIVHKLAAERYLPAKIVHRPKKGFPMPFGSLIRGDWRSRVEAVLFDPSSPQASCLDQAGVRRVWNEHQEGFRDRSRQIFALLAFGIWMQQCHGLGVTT